MTSKPEVNIPLLRKAVEWVESQAVLPRATRQWRQQSWVVNEETRRTLFGHARGCGTAYCLAGWIASQTNPHLANTDLYHDPETDTYISSQGVALDALGLTLPPGALNHPLFGYNNTARDIRRIAEKIAGEKL